MLLVSACLLGHKVRYKGDGKALPLLQKYADCGLLLPFCPEVAGGLPTPRPAAEISGGAGAQVWQGAAQVVNTEGQDVSAQFMAGAQACLETCHKHHITTAILKARSPSCGKSAVYDGSFSGRLQAGQGVTAALLEQHGIRIFTEEELNEELLQELLAEVASD